MVPLAHLCPYSKSTEGGFSPHWPPWRRSCGPLLGEQVGRVRWSAAVLALIGAVVLLRPTPEGCQPAALLAMGLELISLKKLAERQNPFQIPLANNLIGFCIASVPVL